MKVPKIVSSTALALVLAACSHTVTDDGGAARRVFPSHVGATWTYRWQDYRSETVDTVVVSVTGTATLPGLGEASVLVYDASDWSETVYLSARGDTVEFLPEGDFMGNAARFLVPLEVGRKWRGANTSFQDDSCWVSGIEPVTVPMGSFPDAIYVQETWASSWLASSWAAAWVVPGIGVVREGDLRTARLCLGEQQVRPGRCGLDLREGDEAIRHPRKLAHQASGGSSSAGASS